MGLQHPPYLVLPRQSPQPLLCADDGDKRPLHTLHDGANAKCRRGNGWHEDDALYHVHHVLLHVQPECFWAELLLLRLYAHHYTAVLRLPLDTQ